MSEKHSTGNGYRIGIAICDFILIAISVWGVITYGFALEYILRTGEYPEAKIGTIVGLSIQSLLALLLFICFWGVLGRNKAYVKLNKIVYIVFAVLAIVIVILSFIGRNWVAGGIQVAFAIFSILCVMLCGRYYQALTQQSQMYPNGQV
jgi:hypothetical protein